MRTRPVRTADVELVGTAQEYADRITERWQDSVLAIIDTGRWLADAKRELAHGEFGRMFRGHPHPVERPLPFSARAGRMLMAVAAHELLANRNHGSALPPSWRTLYELAQLPAPALVAAIEAGEVHTEMERGDAYRLVKETTRAATPPASSLAEHPHGERRGDGWALFAGDFRAELAHLDAQVDLVVTDPPYADDALGLYEDLAKWAARAVRPGGVVAVYAGTFRLPEVLDALRRHLRYRWTYCLDLQAGSRARFQAVNVIQTWRPVLLFSVERWTPPPWGTDLLVSPGPQKDAHPWQQNAAPVRELIERYSAPGWVVADPFLGAGTTGHAALELGRQFIGCDIDPACVEAFGPSMRA
jgi:hypothetical protein